MKKNKEKKFHKVIIDDLHRGGFKKTIKQDFKDIYYFYIDREKQERLAEMYRIKRFFLIIFWVLKGMILKLSPIRRILLIIALIYFFSSSSDNQPGSNISFIVLLFILILELKDKLVARDEIAMGRSVQFELLPDSNPYISGWEVWLFTRPANDVGGDLVDYLELKDNKLGITLGDVVGKGLGAALLMAKLQATLRALAPNCRSLSELGNNINKIFYRDVSAKRFASMVYLEIEPTSEKVKILNAGHLPPVIITKEKIKEMPLGAPALGIMPSSKYTEDLIKLSKNDIIIVYSDGITEARNEKGDFFGESRLFNLLPKFKKISAEETGNRIIKEVDNFLGEARPNDDISLVILRRL